MNMIHRFMGCIREYKKPTILTLLRMVGEVAIQALIPPLPPLPLSGTCCSLSRQ